MCVCIYICTQSEFRSYTIIYIEHVVFHKEKMQSKLFYLKKKKNTVKFLPAILERAYKTIEKGQAHTAQMYIWSCSISHSDTLVIHV